MSLIESSTPRIAAAPAAESRRLSVTRHRVAAFGFIALLLVARLIYIEGPCPIDLAEDETYYWDWSRQLDIHYYSKGPVTAYLIRAGCLLQGDNAAGVRLPAILMGAGLAACTWSLTLRLFGSPALALGAVLMSSAVPMMAAAGLVMTADPPLLFLWALATTLGAGAIFERQRWAWTGVGVVIGVGLLTKLSMGLWPVGMILFLLAHRPSRWWLRTCWPWLSIGIAALFTAPILAWNIRHGWLTFLHVEEDVGVVEGQWVSRNIIDLFTGQLVVVGPILFLVVAAVVHSLRQRDSLHVSAIQYLLWMAIPLCACVAATTLRKHSAANWPAPAWFTLLILAAWFISRIRMSARWRLWRWGVWPAIAISACMTIIAHDTEVLYRVVDTFNDRFRGHRISVSRIDPTYRVHGWAEIARDVGRSLEQLGPGAVAMASDYQTTAELAFYLPGQPRTYCIGSYFRDPSIREPFSQYDVWTDRRLDPGAFAWTHLDGVNAIYVGAMNSDVQGAFDSAQRLPDIIIRRHGVQVRRLELWECRRFRGIDWPGWSGRHNR